MTKSALKVLFVTSEVTPYSKTGGLADVSAALPRALMSLGCDVRVLSPLYSCVDRQIFHVTSVPEIEELSIDIHGRTLRVNICRAQHNPGEPDIYFAQCDSLYDRPGLYVDPFTDKDYIDNDYRYILLCKAALLFAQRDAWTPDIIHCNDWQTGLAPLYLTQARAKKKLTKTCSVLTIHNIAYHGLFGAETVGRIGGAESLFFSGGPLEFYGHVNFLKAGIEFTDAVNTVSPTYAKEIVSSYDFGYGLENVLRARADEVRGILNGIDVDIWNPLTDPHLAATYDADTLERKTINKRALCSRVGLHYDEHVPLIGIVSRIAPQKGFDLIASALPGIFQIPCQMVVLANGDPHYEHILRETMRIFPGSIYVHIGYDEELGHLIEGGADIFLMPSRYEPCGLNQMMSMRYGTPPVVRATGGLADTVTDADRDPEQGTGFCFTEYSSEALLQTIQRAIASFRKIDVWRRIERQGMRKDFSWSASATLYRDLYNAALKSRQKIT